MDTNRNAGFQSHLLTNPIIRKLSRVTERADDRDAASYGGIFAKTLFFIIMTVAGIVGFLLMKKYYPYSGISDMPTPILLASGAALLITVITPFLSMDYSSDNPRYRYTLLRGTGLYAFASLQYRGVGGQGLWLSCMARACYNAFYRYGYALPLYEANNQD